MQSLNSIFKQSPLCWTISLKKGSHRENGRHIGQCRICHTPQKKKFSTWAHGKNSRLTQVVGVYSKHDIIILSFCALSALFRTSRMYLKRLNDVLVLEVPD